MRAFELLAVLAAVFAIVAGELHDIGGHDGVCAATAVIAMFCGFCALMAPPLEATR